MTINMNATFLWKLGAIILLLMAVGITVAGAAEPLPERPIVPVEISSSQNGSKILLKAPITMNSASDRFYDADDWTVVQWQAVNGTWYDVEGWQGNFFYDADVDPDFWQVEWWVGSDNYREKNFRFVIYTKEDRARIKQTSVIFDLPSSDEETVVITVPS